MSENMAAPVVQVRECVRADKMRMFVLLCICLLTESIVSSEKESKETDKPCDVLYRQGTEAYLDERWQDCIDNLELAISSYNSLKKKTVSCRLKCQTMAEETPLMTPKTIEDLHFYEKMIRKTLCLLKCTNHSAIGGLNAVPKDIEKQFEEMKPYEYLQLCYFQKNMLQKAADAVFTFLVTNPDHVVMQDNLKFYSKLPEVDMSQVINHEARPFVSLYVHGAEAYQNEDYPSVIQHLEESLEDYLRGEEECRAFCEGPFNQGWFPDFVSSIANHFTFCLKCKHRCPGKLNSLNGEKHDDLLPSHYHFLQFAYYKVGNMKKACEAVASYLIFFPVDDVMLNNKEYYMKLPKVQKDYFTPREEAVRYVKRQEYEAKLLKFIETEFVFQDNIDNESAINKVEDDS